MNSRAPFPIFLALLVLWTGCDSAEDPAPSSPTANALPSETPGGTDSAPVAAEPPVEIPPAPEEGPPPEAPVPPAGPEAETPAPPGPVEPPPAGPAPPVTTRVAGRVLAAGRPLAYAPLVIDDVAGVTDADGRFVAKLARGTHPLRFPAHGVATLLVVPEAPEYEVRFELPGAAELSGRVELLDLGLEAIRILVHRHGEGGALLAETATDREGRFRLTGLPSEPVRVVFSLRGRILAEEVVTPPLADWRISLLDCLLGSEGSR